MGCLPIERVEGLVGVDVKALWKAGTTSTEHEDDKFVICGSQA